MELVRPHSQGRIRRKLFNISSQPSTSLFGDPIYLLVPNAIAWTIIEETGKRLDIVIGSSTPNSMS